VGTVREKGVGEEERGEDRDRREKKRVEKRCHLQVDPTCQMVKLDISMYLITSRMRNHLAKPAEGV
jgi:hypothetical protein